MKVLISRSSCNEPPHPDAHYSEEDGYWLIDIDSVSDILRLGESIILHNPPQDEDVAWDYAIEIYDEWRE